MSTPSKHGLYVRAAPSIRLRDKKVQRLVRALRNALPQLQESDLPACRAWAQLEILCDQLYAFIRGAGIFNTKGEAKRLIHDLRQMRQTQLTYATALGLTPTSRLAIRATSEHVAFDLADTVSERALKIAEDRQAETVVEVVDGTAGNKEHGA
jgi:hypothetical protein